MKKATVVLALALVSTSLLSSCAKPSSAEDLKEAQMCLNTSAPSNALNCVSKIASDTSTDAYKLRCAAIFISEGFNSPTSFISALDSLNQTGSCGGGCSSTVNAVTSLHFRSADVTTVSGQDANKATAQKAFDSCTKSGVKAYAQIASIFNIGTIAAMLVATPNPSADAIKGQINNLPAEQLGNIVVTSYNSACTNLENAPDSTKKYCAELSTAMSASGGTPTAIGACLKIKLENPSANCP